MKFKLPSIGRIVRGLEAAIRRFPMAMLAAAVGTVVGLILLHIDEYSFYPNVLLVMVLAFPLLVAVVLLAEQRGWSKKQLWSWNLSALVFLAADYLLLPSNIFEAASSNRNMLQVIFFAVFFGIGLILIPEEKSKTVKEFFDGFNEVILKMVDLIMLAAPYGVFALLAALVVEAPSADLFAALGMYAFCVVLGLTIMIFVYILLVKIFTGKSPRFFLNGIAPAQLLAFSTSSSAATLPVTMERVTEHLGVEEEVSSFVLPIGATINMDGTSLYQAVAAVFIAQAFGMDLSFGTQLGIIATATLASIGSAAVPGAGMVMLVGVLGYAGIPEAGLALIFAVDRPLDMCRTVVNVTGDATVSMIVAKSQGKLGVPHVKDWDDNYEPTR